jgi:hypothetical protein
MLTLSSCFDQGECLITNTNIIRVSLHKKKDNAVAQVTFESVAVLEDTVLYTNKTLSSLDLPVNPGVTEMTYVFDYGTDADTLSLRYTNQSVVLSPSCGAFPYQRNLAVAGSTFGADSVEVTNQSLLKDVKENVRIYF